MIEVRERDRIWPATGVIPDQAGVTKYRRPRVTLLDCDPPLQAPDLQPDSLRRQ